MKFKKIPILILNILFVSISCTAPINQSQIITDSYNHSKISTININKLPANTKLNPDSTKAQLLNAYELQINPINPNCINATKINIIKPYTQAQTPLDTKLYNECDYKLNLKLGHKKDINNPNNTQSLDTIYYQLNNTYQIYSSDLKQATKQQTPLKINLELVLTFEGILQGFTTPSVQTTDTPPTTTPTPPTQPTPTNQTNLASIFAELKIIDSSNKNLSVADIFKGNYILMIFSMSRCGPCITLAQRIKNDSQMIELHRQQKCTIIKIYPNFEDISMSSNSIDLYKNGLNGNFFEDFNNKIKGADIYATPTSLIMNTKGELIYRAVGDTPTLLSKFKTLCSN